MSLQVLQQTLVNGFARKRLVEKCRADADSCCPREHELDRIIGAGDAALADDRHVVWLRCPWCETNLRAGGIGMEEKMEIVDIFDLMMEAL